MKDTRRIMLLIACVLTGALTVSVLAVPMGNLCRGKTYLAEIDKWATKDGVQIGLIVQMLSAPMGTIFDGESYPDRYVIEYAPSTDAPTVEFKFLVTFDPNMCVDPPTVEVVWSYKVVGPTDAPNVPVRPFDKEKK